MIKRQNDTYLIFKYFQEKHKKTPAFATNELNFQQFVAPKKLKSRLFI